MALNFPASPTTNQVYTDATSGKSWTFNGAAWDQTTAVSVTTSNGLTLSSGGAGAASGTTFNGASAVTISYNSIGAAGPTANNFTDVQTINTSGNNASPLLILINTGTNGAQVKMLGNGPTTPSKTLRVLNGVFEIINDAYTSSLFSLSETSGLTLSGNLTVGASSANYLLVNGSAAGAAVSVQAGGSDTDISINLITKGTGQLLVNGSPITVNSVANSLTFNNAGTGAASGVTYNGSAAQTISYNTIGAQAALGFTPVQQGGGTGQSTNKVYIGWQSGGTLGLQIDVTNYANVWPISITGNAATVTNGVYTTGDITVAGVKTYTGRPQYQANSAMIQNDGTASAVVQNISGTGDSNMAMLAFLCQGNYARKIGLRADGYFGLGGWSSVAWQWYLDPSANMTTAGNVTAYSDPRLKKNFKRIKDPLAIISELDGGTFVWRKGFSHTAVKAGKKDYGVLANQVEAVMPEIVHDSITIDGESFKTVSYEKIVPVLIEAVKALQKQVLALEENLAKYQKKKL